MIAHRSKARPASDRTFVPQTASKRVVNAKSSSFQGRVHKRGAAEPERVSFSDGLSQEHPYSSDDACRGPADRTLLLPFAEEDLQDPRGPCDAGLLPVCRRWLR